MARVWDTRFQCLLRLPFRIVAPAYGQVAHRVCNGVVFESDTYVSGAKVNMLSSAVMTVVVVLV